MRHRLPAHLLLLALLPLWACAPKAEPIFGSGPDGARTISIEVVNRNFDDVTVYAWRFADRRRTGVVGGKSRETFPLQWTSSAPLRLEMRTLGGEICRTREIRMEPGDRVTVEVPMDIRSDPECNGS